MIAKRSDASGKDCHRWKRCAWSRAFGIHGYEACGAIDDFRLKPHHADYDKNPVVDEANAYVEGSVFLLKLVLVATWTIEEWRR